MDVAGNWQQGSLSYSWTVDTVAPSVHVIGQLGPPRVTSNWSVSFVVGRSEAGALAWWGLDAEPWQALGANRSAFVVSVLSDGSHRLRLKAADEVGNVFVNASAWRWVRDTKAPTSVVASGPASPSFALAAAQFVLRCTETAPYAPGGADCVKFQYRLRVVVAAASGCGEVAQSVTHQGEVEGPARSGGATPLTLQGLRLGENELLVTAVDRAGQLQREPAVHRWSIRARGELWVNITSGPPRVYALQRATFHFFAHRGGEAVGGVVFHARLGASPLRQVPVACDRGSARCNYSLPCGALGSYTFQIQARDSVSASAPPSVWFWRVAECSTQQYAVVGGRGSLLCKPCPPGANCDVGAVEAGAVEAGRGLATADTLLASKGWLAPDTTPRLSFFRCPLENSCLGGNGTSVSTCNVAAGFAAKSVVCGRCRQGFVRSASGCSKCRGGGMSIVAALLVGLLPLTFVLYKQLRKQKTYSAELRRVQVRRAVVQRTAIS